MVPRSAIAWLVVACASPAADAPSPRDFPPLDGNAQILGIGDSIMAFNEPDQDITAVVADELDTTHELAAVGGETMLGDEANRIPWQYEVARDGQYALVIATGGGNDLGECTCGVSCDPVLDTLISADATSGAIVDLVEQGIADGRQFAWVGYLRPLDDAQAFSDCGPELEAHTARLKLLDDRLDDLIVFDGLAIDTAARPELFVDDGYHPSPMGSAEVGRALAAQVRDTFGM